MRCLMVGITFVVVVGLRVEVSAASLVLVTDTSWRAIGPAGRLVGQSIDAVGQAWQNANLGWNTSLTYNDSGNGWHDAIQDWPTQNPLIIWPDGNGRNGSTPVYFRKVFNIPDTPILGILQFGVDDDAQVYVNGARVYSDTNGLATNVRGLDVTSALLPGQNLLAVKAHNQQGDEGWDATLSIEYGPAPDPSTLVSLAYTYFLEPAQGVVSFTPSAGQRELGFQTTWSPSTGQNFSVGVDTSGQVSGPIFTHRTVSATTTFDTVDLRGWENVTTSISIAVSPTEFETGDFLRVSLNNGADTLYLFDQAGAAGTSDGLEMVAGVGAAVRSLHIPSSWNQATLTIASFTNSSTGAERFDFDDVEFRGSPAALVDLSPAGVTPDNADNRLDVDATGRSLTGLNRIGRGTLAIVNHPGEQNGNLQLWFELSGAADAAIDQLAQRLDALDDVLGAERVTGCAFLANANLHVTVNGGALAGGAAAPIVLAYNFGPGVTVRAVAVPEPTCGVLASLALTLSGLVIARRRLRCAATR